MKIVLLKYHIFRCHLILCMCFIILAGCNGGGRRTDLDSTERGTIHISVDESFKPIIDSQIQVFEALFPEAHIIPHYKPEAECFKDLIKDSTRMIIVTRGLTEEEQKFYEDSLHYSPAWEKVANDAIAVIVNNDA
jgi:phosphate transport system substrate-binding protein